jgi:hypothetical protein
MTTLSQAITLEDNLIVDARSFFDNPNDGQKMHEQMVFGLNRLQDSDQRRMPA